MMKFSLLSTVAVAASLMAAPAFAQNGNNGGNNGGGNSAYNQSANDAGMANSNGYGRQLYGRPAIEGSQFAGNQNLPPVVSPRGYANVGFGTYTARNCYIMGGNNGNGGNNGSACGGNNGNGGGNNGNNAWRPSQRNPDLADNGDARASKVIGTGVYNARDQQLGTVNDILIGRNGVWAVISTNNKKVAVPFGALRFGDAVNNGNDTLVLPNVTQAQLNTLPVLNYNLTNYQGYQNAGNNGNGGHGWFGGGPYSNAGNNGGANNNAGWHGNGVFGNNGGNGNNGGGFGSGNGAGDNYGGGGNNG